MTPLVYFLIALSLLVGYHDLGAGLIVLLLSFIVQCATAAGIGIPDDDA